MRSESAGSADNQKTDNTLSGGVAGKSAEGRIFLRFSYKRDQKTLEIGRQSEHTVTVQCAKL